MGVSPPIEMANIGMADTMILMVLALVVFGPRRLPQIGRQIGKLMYEFRKASNDFKFQMEEELRQAEEADRRKKEDARQQALVAAQQPPQSGQPIESAANADPLTALTPVPSPESPGASADPGASTKPALTTADTRSKDATATAVEAARPRIQPPSTGEVVAANRPGAVSQPSEPAAQDAAHQVAAGSSASSGNEAEPTEPSAQNG